MFVMKLLVFDSFVLMSQYSVRWRVVLSYLAPCNLKNSSAFTKSSGVSMPMVST